MGAVYRKTSTRDLPAGAEIVTRQGQQVARWKDAKGKARTAKVTTGRDGKPRIVTESATLFAKYRDGEGVVRTIATGARTESGALSVLRDLEQRAEKVRCRILSPSEANAADSQRLPLGNHFAAYREHQTAKGLNAVRIRNTQSRLERLAKECGKANWLR